MTSLKLPLVLSHNDMWLGNIIFDKATGKYYLFISKQMELFSVHKTHREHFSGVFPVLEFALQKPLSHHN